MFEENCSFCADIINELIKNGKEVEAVYFASESGLTEQFPPVSLLKSSLQNANSISKKVNFSSAAVAICIAFLLFLFQVIYCCSYLIPKPRQWTCFI